MIVTVNGDEIDVIGVNSQVPGGQLKRQLFADSPNGHARRACYNYDAAANFICSSMDVWYGEAGRCKIALDGRLIVCPYPSLVDH